MAAVLLSCYLSLTSNAQPRAVGLRFGATGLEASYQHTLGKNFIEAEAGMDFGYGGPGFKASASYNFVFARPAWSDRGSWALYAGPGLAMGYVSDRTTYTVLVSGGMGELPARIHPADHGFMLSFTGQVGLEYNFWFPLQLSVDIRPYFGFHINDGFYSYRSKTGFYNYGMMGFIPSLSVRYRF